MTWALGPQSLLRMEGRSARIFCAGRVACRRMATFELVIFDLDGTVVDSLPDIAAALNRTLRGAGREPLALAEVGSYVGDGAARLVQRALPDGFPADALAQLVADFRIQYAAGL